MIRNLILIGLSVWAMTARAQFFWGFPQQERVQPKQEKYVAPSYKGGAAAIEAFVTKNFRQPAERETMDGKIVVAVIVDAKGKVAETHVVRSVSTSLNAEAQRVCRKMKFKSATLGKKKVKGRIDITFPIRRGRLSFLDLPTVDV